MSIILASQSPRRKQLLEWAEIQFDVIAADTDESFPEGLSFEEAAEHIALHKALTVYHQTSHPAILAADTIVVCDEVILGKPSNEEEAVKMLTKLSGNRHRVITGVAVLHQGQPHVFSDTTFVQFNELTPSQLHHYVHTYKPFDKAGAYAIQEWIGVVGIQSVQGDFYNVMGLPVNRVYKLLQQLKIIA
ncbi:MAG TPA: Maf family protein [Ferruginibacter sp.]|nr:Maf family protein [Ferruginibacter sp.]HRO07082.1 Maf family protein [Ferruginibacter sp.]HRO96371.1 Maf family protein [Ferruginibacter sp.]HRP48476.1 Maf family protein [Ferruginibacter sp.]